MFAIYAMSCALVAKTASASYAMSRASCLRGQTAFAGYEIMSCAFVDETTFSSYVMTCAFVAKTALACYAMSRASCLCGRAFFSLLLYWCLARRCPLPVGTTVCWQSNYYIARRDVAMPTAFSVSLYCVSTVCDVTALMPLYAHTMVVPLRIFEKTRP